MVPKEAQFDLTPSYWIFTWFLLFYFGFTSYNPKIWLILALMESIFVGIHFVTYQLKTPLIPLLYIIINVCIKVIPIYLVRNTPYRWADFNAGIVLLAVQTIWAIIRLGSIENLIQYYKMISGINRKGGKPSTPLISLLSHYFTPLKNE